jgi:hypothetical protein
MHRFVLAMALAVMAIAAPPETARAQSFDFTSPTASMRTMTRMRGIATGRPELVALSYGMPKPFVAPVFAAAYSGGDDLVVHGTGTVTGLPTLATVNAAQAVGSAGSLSGGGSGTVFDQDPDNPDFGAIGTEAFAAAKAGRWLLAGTILTFGLLLLLRRWGKVVFGSAFDVAVHGPVGTKVTLLVLGGVTAVGKDLLTAGTVDLKTFGGFVFTAAVGVVLHLIRDKDPAPQVAVAKAGG